MHSVQIIAKERMNDKNKSYDTKGWRISPRQRDKKHQMCAQMLGTNSDEIL